MDIIFQVELPEAGSLNDGELDSEKNICTKRTG